MDSLKKTKLAVIGICGVIFMVQLYYFYAVEPDLVARSNQLEETIELRTVELEALESGRDNLSQAREALQQQELEVKGIMERFPSYSVAAKDLAEIMKMLETNGFSNIRLSATQVIAHEYEEMRFIEREYSVSYVSPFSESKKFLDNMTSSYQANQVSQFKTTNTPQLEEKNAAAYKLLYGEEGYKELVETTVVFSLFTALAGGEDVEAMSMIIPNTVDTFLNIEELAREYGVQELPQEELVQAYSDGDIVLYLEDGLDTEVLKITSYDEGVADETIEVGGSGGLEIYLQVEESGYQLFVMDVERRAYVQNVRGSNTHPIIYICSETSYANMTFDSINFHISNDTNRVVTINTVGRLYDRLHIYNEEKEEVSKGEVKGRVIVR